MHTSRDDYLISTLRFVSTKEETQIYGAILPESFTSPEMKETQAYQTYLGFAIGATPPKKVRKFKKPASPKLTTVLVSTKAPTGKSKKVETCQEGNDKDDSNNEQVSSDEDSDQEKDSDDDKTQSDNENKSDSEHETDESESVLESNHDENEEDEDNKEAKISGKAEGDEVEEMDYTTS
nr:hypothetical protein [Tanacetum cinerariifolium]